MSNFVVVYDACVLHPAALRNLLMRLALTGLFRAKWSEQIHQEWVRSVQERFPDMAAEKIARTRDQMNAAVPDCLVSNYQGLADGISLPDENDRHVVAAAIRCNAGAVVTYNLKDFPNDVLQPFGITAQHPDEFISHLFDLNRGIVCAAVKQHRESLKNPPRDIGQLLDTYLSHGLAETVAALSTMQQLL